MTAARCQGSGLCGCTAAGRGGAAFMTRREAAHSVVVHRTGGDRLEETHHVLCPLTHTVLIACVTTGRAICGTPLHSSAR